MNAFEKVAWSEVIVTCLTVLLIIALIPWLGPGAIGGSGLLGLIGLSSWFLRKRNDEVIFDERDREIDSRARSLGIMTSWQVTLFSLIGLVLWAASRNEGVVPAIFLFWLLVLQATTVYFTKGLVAVLTYRRQARAS